MNGYVPLKVQTKNVKCLKFSEAGQNNYKNHFGNLVTKITQPSHRTFFSILLSLVARKTVFAVFLLISNLKGSKSLKSEIEKETSNCMVAKSNWIDENLRKGM